jgi:hypothetical protein
VHAGQSAEFRGDSATGFFLCDGASSLQVNGCLMGAPLRRGFCLAVKQLAQGMV